MSPKSAIATVTGIGGMAGGVGSMILQKVAGNLFVDADATQMTFMGYRRLFHYLLRMCRRLFDRLTIGEDF